MIQRIQSLFLLIVFVLIVLMLLSPQAVIFDKSGNLYQLNYLGISKYISSGWFIIEHNIITTILILGSLLLSALCIFQYKNRKKQIRDCWFFIIILCLLTISIFYSYMEAIKHFSSTKSSLLISSVFPGISIILVILSMKAIKKDDELVKSIDRIR